MISAVAVSYLETPLRLVQAGNHQASANHGGWEILKPLLEAIVASKDTEWKEAGFSRRKRGRHSRMSRWGA